jgi:hypothetical protein
MHGRTRALIVITERAPEVQGEGPTAAIPPLQQGDVLSRAEFERRYEAMPGLTKAELIEGVVYLPWPVGHHDHAQPHLRIITWLGVYQAATPGVEGGDNGSIRLDLDSEPQPDAYLIVLPEFGDRSGSPAGTSKGLRSSWSRLPPPRPVTT